MKNAPGHESPIELLCRLLETGSLDPESAEWLAYGFRRWLNHGDSLPAMIHFGLPSTPRRLRLAIRDWHLRQAAQHTKEATTWRRARALSEEIERYQGRKAAAWSKLPAAPEHATEIESEIHAASIWGDLPATPQAVRNVLEADS